MRRAEAETPWPKWKRAWLRDFYGFLLKLSYHPANAYDHAASVADDMRPLLAGDKREAAAALAAAYRDRVSAGIRPDPGHRIMIRWLTDRRLIPPEPWNDLLHAGRTRAAIARLDGRLRADLQRYWDHLAEERRHRHRAGERIRSIRTEWILFAYTLVPYGAYLAEHGLESWQQLTPDRFRSVGARWPLRPSTMQEHLLVLRRFLHFLNLERRIFRNPLAATHARRSRPLGSAKVPSVALAMKLVVNEDTRPTIRAVVALIVLHALRPNEVASIRTGDFRPRARTLFIRRRRRTIDLDPLTHSAIVSYLKTRMHAPKNPHLFVSDRTAKTGVAAHFVSLLQMLGLSYQAIRRGQLLSVLQSENAAVVARLFGLSVKQVEKYARLQFVESQEQQEHRLSKISLDKHPS